MPTLSLAALPLILAQTPPMPRGCVDVRDFGALGTGVDDDRAAIQSAIDHAAATLASPPGAKPCVLLTAGVFLSGGLVLRPRVVLYIDGSAILRASTNGSSYTFQLNEDSKLMHTAGLGFLGQSWAPSLVSLVGAHGAEVVGEGVLDGQCPEYITGLGSTNNNTGWLPQQFTFRKLSVPGCERGGWEWCCAECRVRVMSVWHSHDVRIEGVTLSDSHGWTFKLANASDVLVRRVKVYGDWRMPNNDGIDPDSSTNVTIEDCDINTADDAISPKAGLRHPNGTYLPLRGLSVRRSRLRSRSFAVKIGTEIYGNMEGLSFDALTIYASHQGLGIDLRGTGNISGCRFTNINILRAEWCGSGSYGKQNWMGNAQPIFISNDKTYLKPLGVRGSVSDVLFENITSVSENGAYISGIESEPPLIRDVRFVGVRLVIQQRPSNNGTNGPHPAHSDRQELSSQVVVVPPAVHSAAPSLAPPPVPAPVPPAAREPVDGVFVEQASGVSFKRSSVVFAGVPEDGNRFGKCVRLGKGTGGIEPPALDACISPGE